MRPSVSAISAGPHAGGWIVSYDNVDDAANGFIKAQIYNASGAKVGGEISVPTTLFATQAQSTVEAKSDGSLVVAWSSFEQSSSTYQIKLQRLDANGAKVGAEIFANSTTTANLSAPEIVQLSGGGLVVGWTEESSMGTTDVVIRLFNAAGLATTSEITVNTNVAQSQLNPEIAGLSGGGFVVVWEDESDLDGGNGGIFAQRFDASGAKVAGQFLVNENGNFPFQADPSVASLPSGGFVVTWRDYDTNGQDFGINSQFYDATGNRIDGPLRTIDDQPQNQDTPATATLANGEVIVVYHDVNGNDGQSGWIFQQRISATAVPANVAPVLSGSFDVTLGEAVVNAGPVLILPALVVSDSDSANFDGGVLRLDRIDTITPEDQFRAADSDLQHQLAIRNTGMGAFEIGVVGSTVSFGGVAIATITSSGGNGDALVLSLNAAATPQAVEALLENLTYANASNDPAGSVSYRVSLSDGDGQTSQPVTLTMNITPEADAVDAPNGIRQVNTFTINTQRDPKIEALSDGGYVVVWEGRNPDDNSLFDIFSQRYGADGEPLGTETLISTGLPGTYATQPDVAGISLVNGGGHIVVWQTTSSQFGEQIRAQRFDAAGAKVGSEIGVVTQTGAFRDASVIALDNGEFIVGWQGYETTTTRVEASFQRFDSNGVPVGEQVLASDLASGSAENVSLAGNGTGGWVVAWEDRSGNDGAEGGIYLREFASGGTPVAGSVLVNTITAGNQTLPKVAALDGGGYVVVWHDQSGAQGLTGEVRAQIFDNSLTKVGSEFLVNSFFDNTQTAPAVVAQPGGGFAIVFGGFGATSQARDIFVQQYGPSGERIDDMSTVVPAGNSSSDSSPDITVLASGALAVSYDSDVTDGDGSDQGIFHRVFAPAGTLVPTQASPVVEDLTAVVQARYTFGVGVAQQILDPSVNVVDPDSADFDGGTLLLEHRKAATPDDILSLLSGAGISVVGQDVRYFGTPIGFIDATRDGLAGADLLITFNASADARAVRAVIERASYESINTSINSGAANDRLISVTLTDGDGGRTGPQSIFVDMASSSPATGVELTELDTVRTITEAQAEAGAVLDPNLAYVDNVGAVYAGGLVSISYTQPSWQRNAAHLQTLSIQNQGTGPGQIGLSGSDVTDGGVVIGIVDAVSDGTQGRDLIVNLLATATADAVDALLEAITFTSTAERGDQVQFRVTAIDGQGNSTGTSDLLTLSVTKVADGGLVPLGDETRVNAFTGFDQDTPKVSALSDGGYIAVWESAGQLDPDGHP